MAIGQFLTRSVRVGIAGAGLAMLAVLLFVIFFPDAILALPRWIMPKFVQ